MPIALSSCSIRGKVEPLERSLRPPLIRTDQATPRDVDNRDYMLAFQLQREIDDESASIETAAREQRQYDMENRRLATEWEVLAKAIPPPFRCGVCLDEYSEDYVARVPQCQHPFCRDCLRQYVRTKVSEHNCPIFCPTCVAEQETSESEPVCEFSYKINLPLSIYVSPATTAINEDLIHQLGLTQQEYRIFEELQILPYSVHLHCRR
jgi:hypothetical protein